MIDLPAFRPKLEQMLNEALQAYSKKHPGERMAFLVLGSFPIDGLVHVGYCTNSVPSDPGFQFSECSVTELIFRPFDEWREEYWGQDESTIRIGDQEIQPKLGGGGDAPFNVVFGNFFSQFLREFFSGPEKDSCPDWVGVVIPYDYYDWWQTSTPTQPSSTPNSLLHRVAHGLPIMFKSSSPANLRFLISALALGGVFAAWNLWFEFGGWDRQQHWGEEILWVVSSLIGWWAALQAMRIDRCVKLVSGFSMVLLLGHTLSFLVLWRFVDLLANGGPTPR